MDTFKPEQIAKLAMKINSVMSEVSYILKDSHIKYGSTNYKGTSEEAVLEAIRPLLVKHKIIIIPTEVTDLAFNGKVLTAIFHYNIIDAETGVFIPSSAGGQGADTQDKAFGKASTYAGKYLLLKTFWIATGEDPDKTSSEELTDRQRKEAEKERKAAANQRNQNSGSNNQGNRNQNNNATQRNNKPPNKTQNSGKTRGNGNNGHDPDLVKRAKDKLHAMNVLKNDFRAFLEENNPQSLTGDNYKALMNKFTEINKETDSARILSRSSDALDKLPAYLKQKFDYESSR